MVVDLNGNITLNPKELEDLGIKAPKWLKISGGFLTAEAWMEMHQVYPILTPKITKKEIGEWLEWDQKLSDLDVKQVKEKYNVRFLRDNYSDDFDELRPYDCHDRFEDCYDPCKESNWDESMKRDMETGFMIR